MLRSSSTTSMLMATNIAILSNVLQSQFDGTLALTNKEAARLNTVTQQNQRKSMVKS